MVLGVLRDMLVVEWLDVSGRYRYIRCYQAPIWVPNLFAKLQSPFSRPPVFSEMTCGREHAECGSWLLLR